MADKYYRLVSLIVNVCPLPLRELFHRCAQNDPLFTAPYTAHDYMLFRQNDVRAARNIRRDQYDKIYPQNGGQADISDWDITLLATILKLLFVKQISQMSQTILTNIDIIRDARNNLQHKASASSVSDTDFNEQWGDIEDATLGLANDIKGSAYKEDIRKEITKAKTSNMPDLGNVLCRWYEEKSISLENKIDKLHTEMKELRENHDKETNELKESLKEKTISLENNIHELHTKMKEQRDKYEEEINKLNKSLKDVSEDAGSAKRILYKGSRKHIDITGRSSKRFKTEDFQQDIMQRKFSETIKHGLQSGDPISFLEVPCITQKLREDHFVVVCGTSNSLYLQAALTSIKNMGYAENRCFELNKASDWWHITFEEADCIVVVNPFGKFSFDQNKASAMSDLFDSMLSATRDEAFRDFTFRDIVIISEKALLSECKKYFDHELLKSEITILDNSHNLASKDEESVQFILRKMGFSIPPHSPLDEADTNDSVVNRNWKLSREINVRDASEQRCIISRMCMIPPSHLAMTDQYNDSLKVVNISDGRIIHREKFSRTPDCPTLLPQDKLAVLLPEEDIIQLFSIHTGFNKEHAIKLDGKCASILFENNVLFAFFHSPARIKTLNLQGEELSTIALESDVHDVYPVYTAICHDKTSFYISDWVKHLLLRVNMEGKIMAIYKDNGLTHQHDILVMSDESLYVCNKDNSTVLQMSADFSRSRVVLGPLDNIQGPAALCYWPEENIMFLSSASYDPTHRFKLKMFSLT